MTKEELIKNQFPNDEFLQSGVSQIVDKCIAELEKENAELREINTHTLSQLNLDNGELITELTKAKGIIDKFVFLLTHPRTALDTKTVMQEAEQFLKETN